MDKIDLNKEMAWVTFINDGWEKKWFPVTDHKGKHLEWGPGIMDHCRAQFNQLGQWESFGIAPTSQMIISNAVRDNL
jgi:hypothetical protein